MVDDDCEEMITLFHVTGSLLYVDGDDDIVGFDDVFTKYVGEGEEAVC